MKKLIRVMAMLTTFVVLGFLARKLIGLNDPHSLLFVLMLVGVMGLLVRVVLLPANKIRWDKRQLAGIRAHVFLHLVPFSYLALQLGTFPTLKINLLYYLPVALFFYTGRLTWQAFFEAFGSKVYKLFFLGNTGILITLSVLLALSFLDEGGIVATSFQRLFMLYFSVHLLIVGAVVVKIENDLTGPKAVR